MSEHKWVCIRSNINMKNGTDRYLCVSCGAKRQMDLNTSSFWYLYYVPKYKQVTWTLIKPNCELHPDVLEEVKEKRINTIKKLEL